MYKKIKNINGLVSDNMILREHDGAWIPFDVDNSDYQEYLKWLEEGNTPEPADE